MNKGWISLWSASLVVLGSSVALAQSAPAEAAPPAPAPALPGEPSAPAPGDEPEDRKEHGKKERRKKGSDVDAEFKAKANQAIEQTKQSLERLLEQAEQAAKDAKNAPDYEQAVVASERARQILVEAGEQRDLLNAQMGALSRVPDQKYDQALKGLLEKIQVQYEAATRSRDSRKRADEALCGTSRDQTASWLCFYYGAYTAALSRVNVAPGRGLAVAGQSSHQIVSVAVPAVGVRFMRPTSTRFVAADVGAYSAAISPTFNGGGSSDPMPCRVGASEFEKRLPCEGDAPVVPYVAGYLGVTIGKSGIGYLTIVPFTFGVANVGSTNSLHWYYGWMLGVAQIHGTL